MRAMRANTQVYTSFLAPDKHRIYRLYIRSGLLLLIIATEQRRLQTFLGDVFKTDSPCVSSLVLLGAKNDVVCVYVFVRACVRVCVCVRIY